jgi:histidine ammonia-lyase
VLNHRIAQGDVAPAEVVRGAMLCLANSYAKGVTGVRVPAGPADLPLYPAHPRRYPGRAGLRADANERAVKLLQAPYSGLSAGLAAIEFVVAAQAIDLRALSGPDGPGELGRGTGRAYRMIRELVPFTQVDGTLPADLEPLVELITRGDLTPAA